MSKGLPPRAARISTAIGVAFVAFGLAVSIGAVPTQWAWVAEVSKLGEMHAALARDAYKPVEKAVTKRTA